MNNSSTIDELFDPYMNTSEESVLSGLTYVSLTICFSSINLLFGFSLYCYVIWLVVRGGGFASEFFILNLSVCEIVLSLNSLITLLLFCPLFANLAAFNEFLVGLAITGRPLFQSLICVERYLAVVHPVTFLKYKPLRYKLMCSAVIWFISLVSCISCLLFFLFFNFDLFIWFYTVQFLLFLSIQLFCCLAVLRALKQSGPGERGREREEENHMKRRAFYIILITTLNLVVIYLPFTIAGVHYVLVQEYISELFFVGHLFFILSGFVQPVLYLHRAGKLFCFCSA